MVDELIVNRGILKILNRTAKIDNLSIEQLSKIAFRYYRMITLGQNPLDIDERSPLLKKHEGTARLADFPHNCIGCGGRLSAEDISSNIPVCSTCRKKVRADYEMLQDLVH